MEYIVIILVLLLIACSAFYVHFKKVRASRLQRKAIKKNRR